MSSAILALVAIFSSVLAPEMLFAAADGKPPPIDDILNQNAVCPTYSCPKGYSPLPKWPLQIESYGCQGAAPKNKDLDYKHFEQCCHLKNACFQICGTNKQVCDSELEKCMEQSCKDLPGIKDDLGDMSSDEIQKERDDCDKMKGIVKLLGSLDGCKQYDAFQRMHCECVEKDKVRDKMERLLRAFYKKYKPDSLGKVEGLLEKANGKRAAFAKILLGLVTKYPAAIKKKEFEAPENMKSEL